MDYVEEICNLVPEKYILVVPSQVIAELKRLKTYKKEKVSGRDKLAIDLALQLIEKFESEGLLKIEDLTGKIVDDAIIELSKQDKKNIVATLDREMRHILGRVILIDRHGRLMLTR
jgi:rRNA-processing protein FCF1